METVKRQENSAIDTFRRSAARILTPECAESIRARCDVLEEALARGVLIDACTLGKLADIQEGWKFRTTDGEDRVAIWWHGQLVVKSVLVRLLREPIWAGRGFQCDDAPELMEGRFSWVVCARFDSRDAAVAIPRFRTSEERMVRSYTNRKLGSDPIGQTWFRVPRVMGLFTEPAPLCVMERLPGASCYPMTYNPDFSPRGDDEGVSTSRLVFSSLGRIARGLSAVRGEGFGAIQGGAESIVGEFSDLRAYVQPVVALIETRILRQGSKYLEAVGLSVADVARLIETVVGDAEAPLESRVVHGDLRPWNLLFEPAREVWSVADWEETHLGTAYEQLGICLTGMRAHFQRPWVDALIDGYGYESSTERRKILRHASAWGATFKALQSAAIGFEHGSIEFGLEELRSVLPLLRVFDEWG